MSLLIKKFILTSCIVLLLSSCDSSSKEKDKEHASFQPLTVEMKTNSFHLFFSGNVTPLNVLNVLSPVDGTVTEQYFKYGQMVKKGDLIMMVRATQLSTDYHTALTDYIKTKDTLSQSKAKYQGTQSLYDKGFVSLDDLTTDKSSYESNSLELIQARFKLMDAMNNLNMKNNADAITDLQLSDIQKIANILGDSSADIKVFAPADGVALVPDPNTQSDIKMVTQGLAVKAGQILLEIGDMDGFAVPIQINEVNVKQIKTGQAVIISGDAFPSLNLNGTVTMIDQQAQVQSSGIPTFAVRVEVPTLTPEQQQLIYVGMSAKVDLTLETPPVINIPIKAVYPQGSQSMVNLLDIKTDKQTPTVITTGQTSQNDVEVISGLKVGDTIAVPN